MWVAFKALTIKAKIALIGIILLALGSLLASTAFVAYNKGVNEARFALIEYQNEKVELQAKLDKAVAKVDIRYVTKYVEKDAEIKYLTGKTVTIVKEVVPEQYKLSQGWIDTYNASVTGADLDKSAASNPTASPFSDRYSLERIVKNNGVCRATENQLNSLQELVAARETEIAKIIADK